MGITDPAAGLHLIADPHRWRLLGELTASDLRVGELCRLTGDPQNLVSYHLRRLRDAGLVTSRRSSFDGRDTYYRVDLDRCAAVLCDAGRALDPGLQLAVAPPPPAPALRGRRRAPSVLFLCTGNSGRSQIAEALLRDRSSGAVEVRSAGSRPKPVHPEAVRVMADRGIDISHQTSKHVDRFIRSRFDHVVTLCDKVREVCPELPHNPTTAHWSIPDPVVEGDADAATRRAFEAVTADIDTRVRHLLARMTAGVLRG